MLEAMGEAYVSLFIPVALAALKQVPAYLIARYLRRHETYRAHFALCLHHYIAQSEATRVGKNPTYKVMNSTSTQNLLAAQSMWQFLQTHRRTIVPELQQLLNPTPSFPRIPQTITALFQPKTMDWFRIADQLPTPHPRFPGYTHFEGSDQDPDRQLKWQKVFDDTHRQTQRSQP